MFSTRAFLVLLLAGAGVAQQPAVPKSISSFDLERAHMMLRQAHDEVVKDYYDATFHGVDLESTFRQYDARLNSSPSVNDTFRVIAGYLMTLHDSHTFFVPPARQNRSTTGFVMEMAGEKCFITRVRPGTDAAAKLHVGDEVLVLNGFNVKRAAFDDMQYFFTVLSPSPATTLDVLSASGERRHIVVNSLLRQGKPILDLASGNDADYFQLLRSEEEEDHLTRVRVYTSGDTAIWRMPSFMIPPTVIDAGFSRVMKSSNLIIDLRGNRGGYTATLKELLGRLFDHDVKVYDRVSRKETKPDFAKTHGATYKGKLTVLVDSQSASASELFARVVQLEQRGNVVGDRSAGAVMEARGHAEQVGGDYAVFYEFSITSANLLMKDGKSLEKTGVVPDEVMLPTAAELSEGRDPVLAHAAEAMNLKLDAGEAGKLFPYEWPSL